MKPNDEDEFNESWRRAFDDAQLPPPGGGWERVEPHLPPRQRWRAFWGTPWAALLLLLGFGGWVWWELNSALVEPTLSARAARPANGVESTRSPERVELGTARSSDVRDARPARVKTAVPRRPATSAPALGTASRVTKLGKRSVGQAEPQLTTTTDVGTPSAATQTQRAFRSALRTSKRGGTRLEPNEAQTRPDVTTSLTPTERIPAGFRANETAVPNPNAGLTERTALPRFDVALLDGKSFLTYAFRGQLTVPRLPAARPTAQKPPVVKPDVGPRFWLEGGAYVARFNPAVRTNRQLVTATANYNTSVAYDRLAGAYTNASALDPGNAPALSYVSFVIDVRAGMRLTKHWYLESGLQFLRGHSTLTSDVLLVNKNTSGRTSLYAQLLENTARQTVADASQLNAQNVVVPARNLFRYSFDYGSVPVALGYRIRPGKPVNYTISVGLTGDVFLSNRLASATDASIAPVRYGPGDGVYQRFALSGIVTTGLELKLTRQWSLTARGQFRKALTPGIRSGGSVQMYPHTLGVGLGGQYRF